VTSAPGTEPERAWPRLPPHVLPLHVLPPHAPGLKIGLFGGSFDPPHEGHRAASLLALRRLGLDRIWWLVSPGNPLKKTHGLAALAQRLAAAERLAGHPRIIVSALEAAIGTHYTIDTLVYLQTHCPGVRFVWLMGADNLAQLPLWKRWRAIVARVPIAVIDRPGSTLTAPRGRAATLLARHRLDESDARLLPFASPPAYVFLHGPRSPLSSTALRATRTAPQKEAADS
jgi:nicotinate-nucleotide adenylyltransferase